MSDKAPPEPDSEPQGTNEQNGKRRVPTDDTRTSRLSAEIIAVFLTGFAIVVTMILTSLAGIRTSSNLIIQLQNVRETRLEDVRDAIGSNVNSRLPHSRDRKPHLEPRRSVDQPSSRIYLQTGSMLAPRNRFASQSSGCRTEPPIGSPMTTPAMPDHGAYVHGVDGGDAGDQHVAGSARRACARSFPRYVSQPVLRHRRVFGHRPSVHRLLVEGLLDRQRSASPRRPT